MNDYQDSRITQLEIIVAALLKQLGYEALINIQDLKAPVLISKSGK